MDLYIFLGIIFSSTFLLGIFLEKVKIPWIFAALISGLFFSFFNWFGDASKSEGFLLLSDIGLYLLLFFIGFELDFGMMRKLGKFIVRATFVIELLEIIFVGSFVHLVFGLPWAFSFIVALSFATVGEAILLPILDSYKITKTRLGQAILGVATFDDVFELLAIILVVALAPLLLGTGSIEKFDPVSIVLSLLVFSFLSMIAFIGHKLEKKVDFLHVPNIAAMLPLLLASLFFFVGFGQIGFDMSVLGAVFAGIAVKNLLPEVAIKEVEPQIKFITYGLFAPIFFFAIALETNVDYLLSNIFLIIFLTLLAKFSKVLASFLVARKELGTHGSIFMGVALGVRFSTGLVLLKILLDNGLISTQLYTTLIGTSLVFKFLIPFILGYLQDKWDIAKEPELKE